MIDWTSLTDESVGNVRKALKDIEGYFINSSSVEYQECLLMTSKENPYICTTKTKEQAINTIGLENFKAEVSRGGFNVIWIMDEVFGEVKERIKLED